MNCPSCNKFASLEMQDPEVNDVSLDVENRMITADVRIVRNSACCGDEMKEYNFTTETDIPEDISGEMDKILEANPEAEFEVEDNGTDMIEEGGHRYKKSYYGYTMSAKITHDGRDIGVVTVEDKVSASEMDEMV